MAENGLVLGEAIENPREFNKTEERLVADQEVTR